MAVTAVTALRLRTAELYPRLSQRELEVGGI